MAHPRLAKRARSEIEYLRSLAEPIPVEPWEVPVPDPHAPAYLRHAAVAPCDPGLYPDTRDLLIEVLREHIGELEARYQTALSKRPKPKPPKPREHVYRQLCPGCEERKHQRKLASEVQRFADQHNPNQDVTGFARWVTIDGEHFVIRAAIERVIPR